MAARGKKRGVPQSSLFHVSWNRRERGTTGAELLQQAAQAVRSALPATWQVSLERETAAARPGARADALLTITAPDGAKATVLLAVKRAVAGRDVTAIAAQVRALSMGRAGAAMVVTQFVSPMTRQRLDQQGLGWFDATGNVRLKLDHPAVFVERAGADRNEFRDPAERLLKSLRGPAAARVVLELCEADPPVRVRELAGRAQVGAATSARVLDLLDRDAVIVRNEAGAVTAIHKRALLDRWALDYQVTKANEAVATLDPRGVRHALDAVSSAAADVVVTGSAAARAYLAEDQTPVAPLVSLSLYARDPMAVISELGLRRVERGMNVQVLRPYDDVVYTTARMVRGVRCAAPGQVIADLLTGPGRSSEEAEQLMVVLSSTNLGWAR